MRSFGIHGSFWPGEARDRAGHEGKISGYRSRRPIPDDLFSARAGRRRLHYRGWRNQVPGVIIGPPHIKSLQDVKGQRVGISDYNSFATGRCRFSYVKRDWTERDVEWVRIGPSRKRRWMDCWAEVRSARYRRWMRKPQEARFQHPCHTEGSISRRTPERIIAATGQPLRSAPIWSRTFSKALIRMYWFCRDMPKNFEYLCQLHRRLLNGSAVRRNGREPRGRATRPGGDAVSHRWQSDKKLVEQMFMG